jgi:hypothetical protein
VTSLTSIIFIDDGMWNDDHVYIGRGSKWGNPFVVGEHGTREEVIAKYRDEVLPTLMLDEEFQSLRGKTLVCHCWPKPCHGNVLIDELDKDDNIESFFA